MAATGHDVESGDGAGSDERMPQPDVVDVGAEPNTLGAAGEEREHCEHVEDRGVGADRRMVGSRIRTAGLLHRQHEVLRQPHRLITELVAELRRLRP